MDEQPQLEEVPAADPEPLRFPAMDIPKADRQKIDRKIEDATTELDLEHDDADPDGRAD